jgi:hypothetical protein
MGNELDIVAAATELAYAAQVVGNSSPLMPGYVVDHVFDDQWDNTGFYAVAFANFDAGKVVIAIRGSQDRLDLVTDVTLGVEQYLANRAPLIDYIGVNILANQVTICGHSLGGGLSQYLGYDAAREYPAFRKHLVVHTHNGFGGMAGIARIHGSYDPKVVKGVTFRNYRHPDDPVSRIGGHAGGIYTIAVADARQNGLFFAHSNERFLGSGQPSPFEGAVRAKDDPFDIAKTIDELGPELSAALRQIVQNDDPIHAFAKISRILSRIPAKQRGPLFELVGDVLPFGRLWRRFWGRRAR